MMSLPHDDPNSTPSPTGKRGRMAIDPIDMTDPLAAKREKARERQRKKRERDRTGISVAQQAAGIPGLMMHDLQNANGMGIPSTSSHQQVPPPMLTPDEMARKEKVRMAARERQRKHRAVVKARRMAELGLAIPTNPADPLGYRVNEDGEMEPVHDANVAAQAAGGNGAFPATPGQTFAHLLMTSATMNHNMKHHLLRTMQMTNDELASFEPIIAAAWDHWNHQRMHYIQSQAHAEASHSPFNNRSEAENGETAANESDLQYPPPDHPNDYRNRFPKNLEDPTHFQQHPASNHVALSQGNPIDPSLAAQAGRETSAMRSQGADDHESEGKTVSEQGKNAE